MKKGDLIRKETQVEKGETLYQCSSELLGHEFMRSQFLSHYATDRTPLYSIVQDETPSQFLVKAEEGFIVKEDAQINWVMDKEAGISFLANPKSHDIINIEEGIWRIFQESVPSYQSQVATMSDEELREAINASRALRATSSPPIKRAKVVKGEKKEIDPIQAKLDSLPPEQREKLMQKLGLI